MHVLKHACNMHVFTCMSDFTGSFLDYIGNLHRDRISRVERLRRIAFAQEKARQAKEFRDEEERDRIFRKYLNSRPHASFLSDFHTLRY